MTELSARSSVLDRVKAGWVIDVCMTCGRIATWPFCEHRDQANGEPWTMPVSVRPTHSSAVGLAAEMARRATWA